MLDTVETYLNMIKMQNIANDADNKKTANFLRSNTTKKGDASTSGHDKKLSMDGAGGSNILIKQQTIGSNPLQKQ